MLTVVEVIENGIKYRVSEDAEKVFYLKEGIDEPPTITKPSELDLLKAENEALKERVSFTEDAILALMDSLS